MLRELLINLRDPDPACKEYFLSADSDLASICIRAAVFLLPPITYLDYVYYHTSADFFLSALIEFIFAMFSIRIVFLLQRNRQVKTYERLVFTWGLITSLFAFWATFLQGPRVLENLLFSLVFFIANFIALTNRWLFRLIPSLIIYLALLAALLTNHIWFAFASKYMFTLTFIVLTVVAVTVVARNNNFKRTTFAMQRSEQEMRISYETLAMTDPLTGIPNRRTFFQQATVEWNLYKRYGSLFCIAMLDLDRFKDVNDTYGHATGDEALKQYAGLISRQTRNTDGCARIGGEEFAFLFRATRQAEAVNAIKRLQEKLQELKMSSPELKFLTTFSAGVAEVRAEDHSLDDTLRRADQALYRAKDLGRDRIETG